jgi:Bacterial Ig-like domain
MYEVLSPVTDIKKGAYGAAEEACVSLGGITKFGLKYSEKTEDITSAAKNGAVVGVYGWGADAQVDIEGDKISLENLAIAFRGTVDDDELLVTGDGGMLVPYALYVYGLNASGEAKKMYVPAFVFAPDGNYAPERKQLLWSSKGRALRDDVLGGMFQLLPDPAVVTAPTFVSIVPADGASTISRSTDVVITFAVALDAADVNTNNIFMIKDEDNSFLPCTVSQTGAVVTLSPVTKPITASKKWRVVIVPGLHSRHGVVNAVGYEKSFTTTT